VQLIKGEKGKRPGTYYSAETRVRLATKACFTVSEVAADWREF